MILIIERCGIIEWLNGLKLCLIPSSNFRNGQKNYSMERQEVFIEDPSEKKQVILSDGTIVPENKVRAILHINHRLSYFD